jgi:hypothetical protein
VIVDKGVVPSLAGARVLPSLESDLGMALRQGRDTDSNPESRGDFPPCLLTDYFTPGGVKLFPLKRVSYIVEFLPLVGYLYFRVLPIFKNSSQGRKLF